MLRNGHEPVTRNERPGMPQWVWAAWALTVFKDDLRQEQYEDAFIHNIGKQYSDSYWYVYALGVYRIRQAVPLLVDKLQEIKTWEINSAAYGSKAHYMISALHGITGKSFVSAQDIGGNVGYLFENRDNILDMINEWWEEEGKDQYGHFK